MDDAPTPLAQPQQPEPYAQWVPPAAKRRTSIPPPLAQSSSSRSSGQLSLQPHHRKDSLATIASDDSRRSSASSSGYSGYSSDPWSQSQHTSSYPSSHSQMGFPHQQPMPSIEGPHSAPILPVTTSAPMHQTVPAGSYEFMSPGVPASASSILSSSGHSSQFMPSMTAQQPQARAMSASSRPSTAASQHTSPPPSGHSPRTAASTIFSTSTGRTTPPDVYEDEQSQRLFADSAIEEGLRSADLGPFSGMSSGSSSKLLAQQRDSPYARSPEMRVSHKMAERKRRKEMKELFDELRNCLPVDRGMKASKWETLTAAIDHIRNMEAAASIERNRIMELETMVRRLTPTVPSYTPQQQQHQVPPPQFQARHPLSASISAGHMGPPPLASSLTSTHLTGPTGRSLTPTGQYASQSVGGPPCADMYWSMPAQGPAPAPPPPPHAALTLPPTASGTPAAPQSADTTFRPDTHM